MFRLFAEPLVYAAVIAVVIVAGFLGGALGIWASILWGVGVLGGIAIYARQATRSNRLRQQISAGLTGRMPPARGVELRRRCDRNATSVAGLPSIEHMAIKKLDTSGVVNDLATAIEFFVELGLEPGGQGQVEGEFVDRIAFHGTKAELAMLRTPDDDVEIELVKFHSPPTQAATRTHPRTAQASATSPSSSRTSTP